MTQATVSYPSNCETRLLLNGESIGFEIPKQGKLEPELPVNPKKGDKKDHENDDRPSSEIFYVCIFIVCGVLVLLVLLAVALNYLEQDRSQEVDFITLIWGMYDQEDLGCL